MMMVASQFGRGARRHGSLLLAAHRSTMDASVTQPAGQQRSMSLLGAIFGIGEFEAPRNQALSGTTNKSQAYDLALLEYVAMNAHPKFMLQKVLEDDNQFLMGHVLVAASQCLSPMVHDDTVEAAKVLEVARSLSEEGHATANEKLHVAAIDAMIDGRFREAAAVYETILLHDPSDLLAQRCAFDIYVFLGDSKNILSTVARRLPSWSPNDAGFSHLLAMQAYGMQASGKLDAAEMLAEKALSMNGNDRWAFHTALQVLEAKGNANHGASYALQHKDDFDNGGPLEQHLYFQWALFLIDLGRYDRVERFLELYILPRGQSERHSARALCDATHLFWRLHFIGEDVTALQQQLADQWEAISIDEREGRVAFTTQAKLMRYSVLSSVSEDAANMAGDNVPDDRPVDVAAFEEHKGTELIQFSFPRTANELSGVYNAVCHGFMAYSEGRFQDAVDVLLPIRGNLEVLGGTATNRELVELLLVESASRCENLQLAKLLLNEQISQRPQSAQTWSTYSRVSASMGDASAVRDAQGMSYVLGLGQGGNQTY